MWNFLQRDRKLLEAGEKARLVHGGWLSRALRSSPERWPSIPVRKVSEGGFSSFCRTEEGKAWAEMWWETAFLRMGDEG